MGDGGHSKNAAHKMLPAAYLEFWLGGGRGQICRQNSTRLEGGRGKEDVDVIYKHSLTPLQVFHPILSFSVPFIDSFISENNHYLGD